MKVVLKGLIWAESPAVKVEGGDVDSAVESIFGFGINFVILFAFLDRGDVVVGHFKVVNFVVTLVISPLLVNHLVICYSISKL